MPTCHLAHVPPRGSAASVGITGSVILGRDTVAPLPTIVFLPILQTRYSILSHATRQPLTANTSRLRRASAPIPSCLPPAAHEN